MRKYQKAIYRRPLALRRVARVGRGYRAASPSRSYITGRRNLFSTGALAKYSESPRFQGWLRGPQISRVPIFTIYYGLISRHLRIRGIDWRAACCARCAVIKSALCISLMRSRERESAARPCLAFAVSRVLALAH